MNENSAKKRKYILSKDQEERFAPIKELAITKVMKHLDITRDKLLIHRSDANALYGRILIYYILSEFGCPFRLIASMFERRGNSSYICQQKLLLLNRWKKTTYDSEKKKVAELIEQIQQELLQKENTHVRESK
jgi:hypothetical protein